MTTTAKNPERTPFPEFSKEGHQAFSGSDSIKFACELIRQIASATWTGDARSEEEIEARVVAAYEALQNLAPRDELEAMLGVQILATHNAALECLSRCMLENQPVANREYNLKHAAALMALYERQLAAWDRRRELAARHMSVSSTKAKKVRPSLQQNEERKGQAVLTHQSEQQGARVAASCADEKTNVRKE
ncbi:hypothetical protein KUV75_14320 [Qipengyuania gaetbuli]|uniref:hypothetical protein n=1 Tax=Qipengyuania gaetbuli TaxID=266952 RepID=UPI001C994B53|nr:hypothetical protein [Qipengyuania gaetbuli]MBY6016069.1 hypothetical protein [Qipengyuania gaetbuli]